MPETTAEQNRSQTQARVEEPARATPEAKSSAPGGDGHGGVYARFREIASASGSTEPPPSSFSTLFRKSEYAHPVNDAQRGRLLGTLQQQYGNRYVQRVLAPQGQDAAAEASRDAPVQRSAAAGAAQTASPDGPIKQLGESAGRPLDQPTQEFMGSRLGHDFSPVRVHDDGHAQAAARSIGAEAFTTGRDIYFNHGAYQPASESGQQLLAHELTHVVQQDRGLTGMGPHGYTVSQPTDPLEREAEQVSRSVLRGEMFPPVSSASEPVLRRQAGAAAAPPPAAATPPARAATPTPATAAPAAPSTSRAVGDFLINIAGMSAGLPLREIRDVLERATPGGRVAVPDRILRRVRLPVFRINEAALDLDENKQPRGATLGLTFNVPPLEGQGTATVDREGRAQGSVHVLFSSRRMPGIRQTEMDVRVGPGEMAFDASLDFDLPRVRGNLKYKYADQKHSGKGKAQYEGSKLKGDIEIIMSEAGRLSGSGRLEMELFKGLRGQIDAVVDEERNVKVAGELRVPGQVELFPEKRYERSFFNFEKKFPLWGITVPVVDTNVGLFAEIHAGAGFRAKFGPGLLRDIALTGQFGTDPEAATEFGLGGEFFVPAGAEVVLNVGGGIGIGLAIADITGGLEATGVAGLYTALTARPQFRYAGGKYVVSGMAELAGVAQVKFGINAFAKIDVGVWLFKGTVWRKDWTLAEWVWNTGLNIALRANVNYTLGEDFAPDISFETGQVDPEKLVRDVMPESGSPVPAPPKPPVPDRGTLTAEGAQGGQAPEAAPATAPAPPTPGTPPARTQQGGQQAPDGTGQPGPGGAPPQTEAPLPPARVEKPFSLTGEGHTLTAISRDDQIILMMASAQAYELRHLIDDAIAEVEKAEGISASDKSGIIIDLNDVWKRIDPQQIRFAWKGRQHTAPGLGVVDFEHYLDVSLARITAELISRNKMYHDRLGLTLTTLNKLNTPVPPIRYLPHDFRGRSGEEGKHWVRINLYERFGTWSSTRRTVGDKQKAEIRQRVEDVLSTNDAAEWQKLIDEFKLEKNLLMSSYLPEPTKSARSQAQRAVKATKYALDHIVPLARHWTERGNNSDDEERRAMTFEETNLNLITFIENSRKGSEGAEFIPYVKSDFSSTIAGDGKKNARTILSKRFLDENQKELS